MGIDFIIAAIITVVGLATPILLAGLGELVVEKSGVLNLGVEGMMLVGAISGFAVTVYTFNPWFGVLGAAAGGALASLLFGVLVLQLNSNQVATGLALTIFGTGISSLMGLSFTGRIVVPFLSVFPESLAKHEYLQLIFGYSPIVYFALIMVVVRFYRKGSHILLLSYIRCNKCNSVALDEDHNVYFCRDAEASVDAIFV